MSALAVVFVLYATLFPFDFNLGREDDLAQTLRGFDSGFLGATSWIDFFLNVLLFLPVGFAFACLARGQGLSAGAGFTVALVAGCALSLIVEGGQLFLPSRASSLGDMLANAVGSGIGFTVFHAFGTSILQAMTAALRAVLRFLSFRILATLLTAYLIVLSVAPITVQRWLAPTRWDSTFSLILGGDSTGQRPWNGIISELLIMDRALTEREIEDHVSGHRPIQSNDTGLLAHYRFTPQGDDFRDQASLQPPLVWQGAGPRFLHPDGARLNSSWWLRSVEALPALSQRINQSAEFTWSVTVASLESGQSGPARIVSYSRDPKRQNFVLAQQGTDLIVRVRTPVTGENGSHPDLVLSEVFVDSRPRKVVVTYRRSQLGIHVDNPAHTFFIDLAPQLAIFRLLMPVNSWSIRLEPFGLWIYRVLYSFLLFLPIGILMGLLLEARTFSRLFQSILAGAVVVLPPMALECIPFLAGGIHPVHWAHVLLGMLVIAITILAVVLRTVPWLKGNFALTRAS